MEKDNKQIHFHRSKALPVITTLADSRQVYDIEAEKWISKHLSDANAWTTRPI